MTDETQEAWRNSVLRGKRTVQFHDKTNTLVTRTWTTRQERAALIVEMLKSGATTKGIARAFGMTPSSVCMEIHVHKIPAGYRNKTAARSKAIRISADSYSILTHLAHERGTTVLYMADMLLSLGLETLNQRKNEHV